MMLRHTEQYPSRDDLWSCANCAISTASPAPGISAGGARAEHRPANVSYQVQKLENELGTRLLIRHGRG